MIFFRKVGVMYHWRIGRLGGSIYLAKRKPKPIVYAAPRSWEIAVARYERLKGD